MSSDGPSGRRRRNATETREALLRAAWLRFARDGYAATTVRDIADDAGVNVALINRYFASKEGLFEACLGTAVTDIRRNTDDVPLDEIATRMARRITAPADEGRLQDSLMLLLRTSGDERIDESRRAILRAVSDKLAAAGVESGRPRDDMLLRAQIVLAATLGIALLRSSVRLEPLASAAETDLIGPLSDLIDAVLRQS